MIPDRSISFRFAITLVLSISGLATPAWSNFETGMDAYNHGDYATALREWRPLAEQRDQRRRTSSGHCISRDGACHRIT